MLWTSGGTSRVVVETSIPVNQRDLGGWSTAAGRLRPGRLVRGALHGGGAPSTRPSVARGAIHLLDLRSAAERGRADEPNARAPAWVCPHPWPLQDPEWACSTERTPAFFVASALRLVPRAAAPVADALALLGRGECVHVGCRLGKDRTGLVVLLLGRLFGVPDPELVRDYLRTAEEFAAAPDWVRAYAQRRGEHVDRVAARLRIPEEVPAGILAALPARAELITALDLSETVVDAALGASTQT